MIYYQFNYEPVTINNNGYEIRITYKYLYNLLKNHSLLKNAGALVGKRLILKGHKVFCKEVFYEPDMYGDFSLTLTVVGENQPKGEIKEYYLYGKTIQYYA
jgi:hypothetical protein